MTRWGLRASLLGLTMTMAACSGSSTGTGPLGGGGACPNAQLDDIWLNKRLGCLSVGEDVSATVRTAPGDRVDRAFVVSQQTFANGFNNVLPGDDKRYFKYLVCVHDAPVDLTSPSSGVSFATDLVVAFRVMSLQPAEVDASTLSTGSAVDTPCDPTVHPLIIDGNGKVESLNTDALGALTITDMPFARVLPRGHAGGHDRWVTACRGTRAGRSSPRRSASCRGPG